MIYDVFLMCKIANLAQNGTKLGRVGRPQCVGPKILGRGWTHQLPQASLERNLDICGPFFDIWFTKVESGPFCWHTVLTEGRKPTNSSVRPNLTEITKILVFCKFVITCSSHSLDGSLHGKFISNFFMSACTYVLSLLK